MARAHARLIADRRSALSLLLLMLLLLTLAGCALRLIQPYDETIEQTVSDFYEDFFRFTIVAGRERGTFTDSRGFYDKWQPKLKTLTARALVANPTGKCPGTETYGGLLPQGVTGARASSAPAGTAAAPAASGDASTAPPGDCIAQLLQLLEDQFDDFAKFHEAQGDLGLPPNARAPRDLVLTSARAVLYVELARKPEK